MGAVVTVAFDLMDDKDSLSKVDGDFVDDG